MFIRRSLRTLLRRYVLTKILVEIICRGRRMSSRGVGIKANRKNFNTMVLHEVKSLKALSSLFSVRVKGLLCRPLTWTWSLCLAEDGII